MITIVESTNNYLRHVIEVLWRGTLWNEKLLQYAHQKERYVGYILQWNCQPQDSQDGLLLKHMAHNSRGRL